MTLIFAGWVLALLYGLALYAWQWSALAAAHSGVLRLRHELYHQSVRLGAGDLLLGQKQSAVELFVDGSTRWPAGLAARARAIPHSILLLVLLLGMAMMVEPLLTLAAILLAVLSGLMLAGLRLRGAKRRALGRCSAATADHLGRRLAACSPAGQFSARRENFQWLVRSAVDAMARGRVAASAAAHIVAHPAVAFFVLAGVGLLLLLGGIERLARTAASFAVRISPAVDGAGRDDFSDPCLAALCPGMPQAEAAAAEIMAYLDRQPAVGQVPEARPLMRPEARSGARRTSRWPIREDISCSMAFRSPFRAAAGWRCWRPIGKRRWR